MDPPGCSKAHDALVIFPGALGDFLCLVPALFALQRTVRGQLVIAARDAWTALLRLPHATSRSIEGREFTELFRPGEAPSARTRQQLGGFGRILSWTGAHDANFRRNLLGLGATRVDVFPFRGMRAGEHAAEYFGRCLGFDRHQLGLDRDDAGAEWAAAIIRADSRTVVAKPRRNENLLVVHAGSGAHRKNWQGFSAALDLWRQGHGASWRVIEVRGPAESNLAAAHPSVEVAPDLSLPEVAGLLTQADLYLGNDSGISHLAGILGCRGVALFGPSDPQVWRPLRSGLRVVAPPHACHACGDVLCAHRLAAEDVVSALHATWLGHEAGPAGGQHPPARSAHGHCKTR